MDEFKILKKNFLSFSVKITTFILLLISIINFNLIKIINNFKIKYNKTNLINNFFYIIYNYNNYIKMGIGDWGLGIGTLLLSP